MSFKNNLLVGTSLSVTALSFFSISSAFAGFEWVPPEKKKPVEVIRPIEPTVVPAPTPEAVVEEIIEEVAEIPAENKPEISITVLDEDISVSEADEDKVIEVVETIEEEQPSEAPEQISEAIENVIVEPTEELVKAEPEVIEVEPEIIEIEPELNEIEVTETPDNSFVDVPVEPETVQQPDNSLTLDFNPDSQANSESQTVAILPEDTEQDISEIQIPEQDEIVEAGVAELPSEEIFWAKQETYDVVEGFGNDIPLALALRQVVPARYAFKFEEGVNAGQKVSWQGGKPWNEVLENALSPIGVRFAERRSTLISLEVVDQAIESAALDQISETAEPDNLDDPTPAVIEVPHSSSDNDVDENTNIVEVVEEIEDISVESTEIITEASSADLDKAVDDIATQPSPLEEIYGDVSEQEKNIIDDDPLDFSGSGSDQNDDDIVPLEEQKKNEVADSEPVTLEEKLPSPSNENINWNETKLSTPDAVEEIASAQDAIADVIEKEELNDQISDISAPQNVSEDAVISSDVVADIVETLDEIKPAAAHGHHHGHHSHGHDTSSDIVETSLEDGSFRFQPSGKIMVWQARKGVRVKRVLEDWAEIENIEFSWIGDDNARVDKDVFISGTFGNAVEILMDTSVSDAPRYSFENENQAYKLLIDAE